MKLYIFHGVGARALSQKISSLKTDFDPLTITELNSKEIDWSEAKIMLASQSLFQSKRLVILEDFTEAQVSEISDDPGLSVILKFSKTLPASSQLLKTPGASVINFTENSEQSVFPFLDKLAEKNPQALVELDSLYQEYGAQYLLTMMAYLLRRMVQTPKNLPPFVMKKLSKQKQFFPIERLVKLYRAVLETDFKIKSGLMEERTGLSLLAEQFLA